MHFLCILFTYSIIATSKELSIYKHTRHRARACFGLEVILNGITKRIIFDLLYVLQGNQQ